MPNRTPHSDRSHKPKCALLATGHIVVIWPGSDLEPDASSSTTPGWQELFETEPGHLLGQAVEPRAAS